MFVKCGASVAWCLLRGFIGANCSYIDYVERNFNFFIRLDARYSLVEINESLSIEAIRIWWRHGRFTQRLEFKIIFYLFGLWGVAKLIWVSCGPWFVLSAVPFVNVQNLVHQTTLNILLTLNSIQLSFLRFHWLRWIKYSNMRELGTNFHLNFVIAPNTWKCFLADLINLLNLPLTHICFTFYALTEV